MANDTIQVDKTRIIPGIVRATGYRLAEFRWILLAGLVLMLLIAVGESGLLPLELESLLPILRLPLGLAYVLFVPGYCLTAALFPGQDDLDGIERTGLSLGLSVAWVPAIALILDRLPWELRLWPIVFGQFVSILIFTVVAAYRRAQLPAGEAYAPPRWRPRSWWRSLPIQEKRIYQIGTLALLLASLALAWVFLFPSVDEFMTEFYILGEDGLAENYPREVSAGEAHWITMGISNKERQPMSYRVEVWAVDPWDGRRERVGESDSISLEVDQSIEQTIDWYMPWPGDDQVIEFYLYADGQEELETYRRLRLWLSVVE